MKQEDKELLLKDLCARLPYGVKVNNEIQGDFSIYGICENYVFGRNEICHIDFNVEKIKPYLFPLSSMTEEQKMEIKSLCDGTEIFDDGGWMSYISIVGNFNFELNLSVVDWLNKNHIDYRGLIEKNLAIDATGKGIY